MSEFEAGGARYRTRPMCCADQFALLATLRPVLPALQGMDASLRVSGPDVFDIAISLAPLMAARDEDLRAVFEACFAAVERADEAGAWRAAEDRPPLAALMRVVTQVVAENFTTLFAMKRPKIDPIPFDAPRYKPVMMPNGEDWLFRPVLRGCCKAESLYDGTLRIEHLAKLSDALDCADENEARARKAAEKK